MSEKFEELVAKEKAILDDIERKKCSIRGLETEKNKCIKKH